MWTRQLKSMSPTTQPNNIKRHNLLILKRLRRAYFSLRQCSKQQQFLRIPRTAEDEILLFYLLEKREKGRLILQNHTSITLVTSLKPRLPLLAKRRADNTYSMWALRTGFRTVQPTYLHGICWRELPSPKPPESQRCEKFCSIALFVFSISPSTFFYVFS